MKTLTTAAANLIGRLTRRPRTVAWTAGCTICGYHTTASGPVDAYELIRSHHCPPRTVK